MYVLSKSKALISGRYHHLIFSFFETRESCCNAQYIFHKKILGLNYMYKEFFQGSLTHYLNT